MKNQYFGDQRDYFKYGLLRKLTAAGDLRLGVCWMLTGRDGKRDGRKLEYLRNPQHWQHFDPPVFDALNTAVREPKRSIGVIQRAGLLGPKVRFFSRPVPDDRVQRAHWFVKLLRFAAGSDLLFFDPDNGFEVASTPVGRKHSSKYLAWSEARDTLASGYSMLVYQHVPRYPGEVDAFVADKARRILDERGVSCVTAVCVPDVIFYLIAQPEHAESLSLGVREFERVWTRHVSVSNFP